MVQENRKCSQAMIQEIQQKTRQYAGIENVHWKSSSEFSDSKNLDFITDFLKN